MLDAQQQLAVIDGLRSGRGEAWAALYDAYAEDAWRYAARLVGGDRDAVADVVQETFLAAARAARGFDPERGALRSWLLGIVHLQAARHWERRRRDGERTDALRREFAAPGDGPDPAAALARREQAERVRRILADLPAEASWLLVAKYVEDRPIAELSAELATGAEAVRSKLARARRLFRNAVSRRRELPSSRGMSRHE
jgi:RNA polymerase sigma-70 factor (ECF subfamily)